MRSLTFSLTVAIAIAAVILSTGSQVAAAQKTKSLLILPFNLNAPEDLGHLQQGVMAMLDSHLSIPGEIELIAPGAALMLGQAVDANTALDAARNSGADYVLYGSVSFFGSYVSCDALLLDVSQGGKVGSFNRSGNSVEELPDHIAAIAADVRGLVVLGQQPDRPQATVTYQNYSTQSGNISYLAPSSAGVVDLTLEYAVDGHLSAIAAGDVDGDGNNEICVASVDSLILYRWEQGQLVKLDTMKVSPAATILGLDIVDLNGNGRSEIFVSNYHEDRQQLNSYVVEWDGASFTKVAEKLPWFFNSLPAGDENGRMLIGQQMGRNSLYSEDGLFEMVWSGGQYVSGQKLDVPAAVDIYGFTGGDFMQTGNSQFAVLSNKQDVSVIAADSSVLWQSSENDYGGGLRTINIEPSRIGVDIPSDGDKMLVFLNQRILSADWDKDGRQDMIIVRNKNTASKYLPQTRTYKSGAIDVISWEGRKSNVLWTTGAMAGYTSDYIYADVTNDGIPELVAVQVVKKSVVMGLLGKSTSVLRVWGKE
jgi:TolB-like protein